MLTNFIEWCMLENIEILTVYAFSTENWGREKSEIDTLMSIFTSYLSEFESEAMKNQIKVKVYSTGK